MSDMQAASSATVEPSLDLRAEYSRLGVGGSADWKIDDTSNAEFELCTTYPRALAVPTSATNEHMASVARYRSRGRLPIMCWRQGDGSTGTLVRCSQPGQGLLLRTSVDDEAWIRLLGRTSGAPSLVLMDSRSALAARANRFRGGGVEPIARYGFPRVNYCALRNVHFVKRVAQDLRDCSPPSAAERASGDGRAAWSQSRARKFARVQAEWLGVQARPSLVRTFHDLP